MRRGPPDMSSTIRRFAFYVTRNRYPAPIVNADNFPVTGAPTADRILAHFHPASGEQLERLPAGLEARNTRQGYTTAELRLGDETTGRRPDAVVLPDGTFEVVEVSAWSGGRTGARTWRQCLAVEVQR